MSEDRTRQRRVGRLVLVSGLCLGVLTMAFEGWMGWRAMTACRGYCAPDPVVGVLTLRSGVSVPLVRKFLWRGSLCVTYQTQTDMKRASLCSEARLALQALQKTTDLEGVVELVLEPTDPRVELIGWEWSGPILCCCEGTRLDCTKGAIGGWRLSEPGFCGAD